MGKAISVALLALVVAQQRCAEASWKDVSRKAEFANMPPFVFAPGGRLYSVEVTAEAGLMDLPCNNLAAVVHCRDGVVAVASEPESPYLDRNETTTSTTGNATTFRSLLIPETGVARPPFVRLSTDMWAVTAGNTVDSQLLRLKLHRVADEVREEDQSHRPDVVARRLADHLQTLTQDIRYGRVLAAYAVIFTDQEVWRVDPTGQFWKCRATLVGRACFSAESKFLESIQDGSGDSSADAVKAKLADMSKHEALSLCTECVSSATLSLGRQAEEGTDARAQQATLKGVWIRGREDTWYSNDDLHSVNQSSSA